MPVLYSARMTHLHSFPTNDLPEKEPKRTGSRPKKRAKKDEIKQKTFSRVGSPHVFRVAEQKRKNKIARELPVRKGLEEWDLCIYLE